MSSPPTQTFWLHPSVEQHKELNNILSKHKAKIYKTLRSPALTHIIITSTAEKQDKTQYQPHHILVTPEWVISTLSDKTPAAGGVLRGEPNNTTKTASITSPQKRTLAEDTTAPTTTTATRAKPNTAPKPADNVKVQLDQKKSTPLPTSQSKPLSEENTIQPGDGNEDNDEDDDEDDDEECDSNDDAAFVDDGSTHEYDDHDYNFNPELQDYYSGYGGGGYGYDSDPEDEDEDDDDYYTPKQSDYCLTKRLKSFVKPTQPTPQETNLVLTTKKGLGMIPNTNKADPNTFPKIVNARNFHQPPKALPQTWNGSRQIPPKDFTGEDFDLDFWYAVSIADKPCPRGSYGRDAEDDSREKAAAQLNLEGYSLILERYGDFLTQQAGAREDFKTTLTKGESTFALSDCFENPDDLVYCPSCDRWGRVRNHLATREGCHHCLCYCNACEQNFHVTEEGMEKRSSNC